MPRVGFGLLLLVVTLLQTAVVPVLGLRSYVDLLAILTLCVGFMAPLHFAQLAGWMIGLVYGLATLSPLGVHAFALGLAAWIVTLLRGPLNADLWWLRVAVGLAAIWPAQLVIALHARIWEDARPESLAGMIAGTFLRSASAALLAAFITLVPGMLRRRRRRNALRPW
jgi:rod shape-determining protein MreD